MASGISKMRETTKKRNRKTQRNQLICQMRQQGMSYRQLSQEFNISIIRVRQILEVWNEQIESGGHDQVCQY